MRPLRLEQKHTLTLLPWEAPPVAFLIGEVAAEVVLSSRCLSSKEMKGEALPLVPILLGCPKAGKYPPILLLTGAHPGPVSGMDHSVVLKLSSRLG